MKSKSSKIFSFPQRAPLDEKGQRKVLRTWSPSRTSNPHEEVGCNPAEVHGSCNVHLLSDVDTYNKMLHGNLYNECQSSRRMVTATTYSIHPQADVDFLNFFERSVKPELMNAGAEILAYFVTENSENNFPVHPIRENEHVLVCFSGFADETAYNNHLDALASSTRWRGEVSLMLNNNLSNPPEVRKLSPTVRSLLR